MDIKENKKVFHSNLRMLGVDLPVKKHVHIALQSIYGIGKTLAVKICNDLKIDMTLRLKELSEDVIAKITKYIEEDLAEQGHLTEGNLKSLEREQIRVLYDINCYRADRLRKGLTTSRTKTNAKTVRLLSKRKAILFKSKKN